MKKTLILGILALCLMMNLMLPAFATETTEATEETTAATEETTKQYSTAKEGTCGDDLTWVLEEHELTITGEGEMDDGCPWEFYKDTIEAVYFRGEITTVGAEAFAECNNLEYVDFGNSLVEIGEKAFYSCNALEVVRLPESFRKLGPECFRDCENLKILYFEGPMPSFKASCVYTDHTIMICNTVQNPWPQAEIDRLMSNFGTRIYVQTVTDTILEEVEKVEKKHLRAQEPVVPETLAATEPPTEPATEPAPVMATEPQPVTEPPVETTAATEAPTEPEPTAPVWTEPEQTQPQIPERTEPETVVEKAGSSGWIWIVAVAAGLTGLLVLALIIRSVSHKGGRYSD